MDAVSTGLNSWDEAMLSSAAAATGGMPLRVDTCELNIACDAGDSTAATEWTDAGGRHLRLLFDGVTEEEATLLELSIAVTERFYCLRDDLLFVRSAPAVEARFAPLGVSLNYVYDDDGNCVRFAPRQHAGSLQLEAGRRRGTLLGHRGHERRRPHRPLQPRRHFRERGRHGRPRSAHSGERDHFPGFRRRAPRQCGHARRGDELVHTAILSGAQAEAVYEDPSLLGFAEMPVVSAD